MIDLKAAGVLLIFLMVTFNHGFSEEVVGFKGKHVSYFTIPVDSSEYQGDSVAFGLNNTLFFSYKNDFYGLLLSGEIDFKYTNTDLGSYESSFFPREAYFYLSSDWIYFSLGNQLINWGLGKGQDLGNIINPKKYWNGLIDIERKEVWAFNLEFFITYYFIMKIVYLPIGSPVTDLGEDINEIIKKNFSQVNINEMDKKTDLKDFEVGILFDFKLSSADMALFYLYNRDHNFSAETEFLIFDQQYVPVSIDLYRDDIHSMGFYGVIPFSFYNLWWDFILQLSDNGFMQHERKTYPVFSWSSGWEFFLGSRQETIFSLTYGGMWRIGYKTYSSFSEEEVKRYYNQLVNDVLGGSHEGVYYFIQMQLENQIYFYKFYQLISKLRLYYGWPLFFDESAGERFGDIFLIPEFEFKFDNHFSLSLGLQYFYSLTKKDGKTNQNNFGRFSIFEKHNSVFVKLKYSWEILNSL